MKARICSDSGGSGEIRTHGPFRVAGFQDRCNRPLCHASSGAILAVQQHAPGYDESHHVVQAAVGAHAPGVGLHHLQARAQVLAANNIGAVSSHCAVMSRERLFGS